MRHSNFSVMLVLCFVLLASLAAADYVDAGATVYAVNGTTVSVKGLIKHDNTSAINYTNVTANINSLNATTVSPLNNSAWATGFYEFNITAPITPGRYNVSLSVNLSNGTTVTKNIEIRAGPFSNATFNFTNKRPPFANGSYFELNISFAGLSPNAPSLQIFKSNAGNSTGWVMNNITSRINTNSIFYNITVPTDADGKYMIIFDEGSAGNTFLVKSGLITTVQAQDNESSTTTTFGQGETGRIEAKVRDENNPITNANVLAFVTFPNGTVVNVSLVHYSGSNGTYNMTFTYPNISGTYKIDIVTNTSGKILRTSTTSTVQGVEARLDTVKDFFFDFGSQSGFRKGGNVEFNIIVSNLSTDALLNGSLSGGAPDVYCNATRVTEMKNVLSGAVQSSPSLTKTTNLFVGQTVCKIRFTAPDADGIYSITVNASIGSNQTSNLSVSAAGYFSVQSYILKPSPVLAIGSGQEFLSFLMPGDNATFELSVRNLSAASGAAIPGNLITSFRPTKITPMDFIGGGQSEISNVVTLENTSGTATTNPKVKLKIPENKTGPFQIEFEATVNGSVIRGTSFYFARYVEGFAFPASFGGGFGPGAETHEGEGFGSGGGTFKCSGSQNFTAKIFDVRTRQAAKSVTFNSIQEAREELTGKSVKSQLSIASSSSTDSSGLGNLTISFSGQFSGFYFMLLNITTSDGKSDTLPSGFECRQLSFFPQIAAIGSTGGGGFFVAPGATLNITVSGIRNLNTGSSVSTGTVSIAKLESFDPGKGHKALPGPATTYPLVSGNANFNISPSSFPALGGKWFNGFNNLRIQVCDNSTTPATCDTSFGGFMVVAFDAFLDFSAAPATTVSANTNVTYRIMAKTNVSRHNEQLQNSTVTGFTAQIGLPWEGSVQDVTVINASLVSDGWNDPRNNTDFNGFERWDVNLSMPENIRKGFNMIIIKVNNSNAETVDVMTFVTASKLAVSVPDIEGIFTTNNSALAAVANDGHVAGFRTAFSTDLSVINSTFKNTSSKSGGACVIKDFNTTRFGQFSQPVNYRYNTTVFILDNGTAGTYDVLVINNSGSIAVATTANRSLASAGFAGLYLVRITSCGFAEIVNSTLNGTGFGAGFGGQHAVSTLATIPLIVKQSGRAKGSVFVDVSQLVVQQDFGGGRGGFGFDDFLPASNFTRTGASTDANGIAFLSLTVNKSGSFSVIWNLSDAGETDTADFSQGIPIEIKTFVTSGGIGQTDPRTVSLTRTNLTRNSTHNTTDYRIYYGTWDESSQGVLLNDFSTSSHHIVLRNTTQIQPVGTAGSLSDIPGGLFTELVIDDDANVCTNCTGDSSTPLRANWTDSLAGSFGSSLAADGANETTINGTAPSVTVVFGNPMTTFDKFLANSGSSTRVHANVTVRVCAETFTKPQTPLISANVTNLTTQSFSFSGPPTVETLNLFDPISGANVTSVLTGPSGCATFNVTRFAGWKSGTPNQIKAKITSSGNTEDLFVGNVFVACPTTGNCF